MRSRLCLATFLTLSAALAQTENHAFFEVAAVALAPSSARSVQCSGGPGTADPGTWRCANVPLWFVITRAYAFEAYQFRPNHPCCQARFDFTAKVPQGTTKEQFQQMLQNLLKERFKLALHHEQKEMQTYELTVTEGGPKLKPSDAAPPAEDPWAPPTYTIGKDGYPVFPSGHSGSAGPNGHYRWVAFHVPVQEIVKTLSFYLGRPVVDATKLTAQYDVDLKWGVDVAWLLESSGHKDEVGELPDTGPVGPNLLRAVHDQLGLNLSARKGLGDIVIIDHVEKLPTAN